MRDTTKDLILDMLANKLPTHLLPWDAEMAGWDIYLWSDNEHVAEVTLSWTTGSGVQRGESYMQGDLPWGLAVCAAVERLAIAIEQDAEVGYHRDRLFYLMENADLDDEGDEGE